LFGKPAPVLPEKSKVGEVFVMLVLQAFATLGETVTGITGTNRVPQVHLDGAPGTAAGTHG
jgi:hypothetical protein